MGIPGAHWPASQAKSVSCGFGEKPCSIDKAGSNRRRHPTSTSALHTYMHAYVHPQKYAQAHTIHICTIKEDRLNFKHDTEHTCIKMSCYLG